MDADQVRTLLEAVRSGDLAIPEALQRMRDCEQFGKILLRIRD